MRLNSGKNREKKREKERNNLIMQILSSIRYFFKKYEFVLT